MVSTSAPTHEHHGPARLRVLVVDDDKSSRDSLATAVRALGADCEVASDGATAWHRYCGAPWDMIIADWNMPGMTGTELCRRVRSVAGRGYTYFVLATAYGDKQHFLEGMDAGSDDYLPKPIDLDTLQAKLRGAERRLVQLSDLERANDDLRCDSERLFAIARVDGLTGLSNRRRLDEDLSAACARAAHEGAMYSIAMCDIDHLKGHNDHFGHLAGDEVIRAVAQAVAGSLRAGDAAYRYGGDELVVLLPGQTLASAETAMNRARAAVQALAIPTFPKGIIGVSIGVAELAGEAPEQTLRRADDALLSAKRLGRSRVITDRWRRTA